jgi:hypothetical protein
MTERELAICCAVLERRALRYRLQPWSKDSQAGIVLWFVAPGGHTDRGARRQHVEVLNLPQP